MDPTSPLFHPLRNPGALPTAGPLVSVLIPVSNGEGYLAETIASILLQSYRSLEIVINDDCSTDGSFALAQTTSRIDPRITVYCNQTALGFPSNRRRLMERSAGSFVMVLRPGDRLCGSGSLARLIAAIESEPDIVLATGWSGSMGADGTVQPAADLLEVPYDVVFDGRFLGNTALQHGRNCIGDGQVLYRRACTELEGWTTIGGFRASNFSDSTLVGWLNILRNGQAAYLAECLTQSRSDVTDSPAGQILKDPTWLEGWYQLLLAAREQGYLEEPSQCAAALKNTLQQFAVNCDWLPQLQGGEREAVRDSLHAVAAEMIRQFQEAGREAPRDAL